MDYSKMSDFEINCGVARAAGLEGLMFFGVDSSFCAGPVWNVPSGISDDGFSVSRGNPFNPCNNPADAWPIITEHRIMLNPYCADELWKCEVPCLFDGFMTTYAAAYDKNPLRAAMVVYLMMQEAK